VGFFTAAVTLLLVILWDGIMRPWEAGLMIALYLFYVAIVVFGSWWDRRQEVKRHSEAMERAQYDETPLFFQEPYRDHRE
jgi:sodium/potassium/calcium exchanger 6